MDAPATVAPDPPGAPEQPPRRLGHQPSLDAARGVAWSVVFVAHAYNTGPLAIGQPAMFVFFALSGFLITELLLEEHGRARRVSLRNFFARRSLRLLPALVVFLVVWLAVVLVAGAHARWTASVPGGATQPGTSPLVALEGVAGGLGYVTNWLEIAHAYSGYLPLGHLWSLAVEEQFYVLWAPLVALALLWWGRKGVAWVACSLAALSLADATILHGGSLTLSTEMSTATRAGAFLIGAAFACAWSGRARWLTSLGARWRRATIPMTLVVMLWASWIFNRQVSAPAFDAAWISVSLASGLLVVAVVSGDPGGRPGGAVVPILSYLGRRSYGLYLWHYVWLTWLAGFGFAGTFMALGASLVCAELSWQLVERRALAFKARFSGAPPARAPTSAPAAPGEGSPADARQEPDGLVLLGVGAADAAG